MVSGSTGGRSRRFPASRTLWRRLPMATPPVTGAPNGRCHRAFRVMVALRRSLARQRRTAPRMIAGPARWLASPPRVLVDDGPGIRRTRVPLVTTHPERTPRLERKRSATAAPARTSSSRESVAISRRSRSRSRPSRGSGRAGRGRSARTGRRPCHRRARC